MRNKILTAISATLVVGLSVEHARADQALRVQRTQRGDIVAVGNTFGFECDQPEPYPIIVGEVGECGLNTDDSTPDLFWRSEPNGTTSASLAVAPGDARSGAVLTLPATASVSRAFLYWMGTEDLDSEIVLDGPGFEGLTISAQGSATTDEMYQAWADVTGPVSLSGAGYYQVSGVDSRELRNVWETAASAWTLIVLTEDPSQPTRNLAVFDGLDWVTPQGESFSTTLSGFLVPQADFVARLGVVTYEGDGSLTGDQLFVNALAQGSAAAEGVNPVDNFFNGTRSSGGVALSVPGDLPQLSGGPSSMGGYDLDEIDISSALAPGATSMVVGAATSADQFALGIFYTSIQMVAPDFTSSVKSASYEGTLNPGEEVTFTITLSNTGERPGRSVTLTDALPPEMIYVPGSATIAGDPVTDQAGDDGFEVVDGELTFRPGTGADSLISEGLEVVVTFRVTVAAGFSGPLSNQAEITAFGQQGEGPFTWLTRSPTGIGPTTVDVAICEFSDDCPDGLFCLAQEGESNQCVECLSDDDCGLGVCSATNVCECDPSVMCTVGVGACERTGFVACSEESITCGAEPGEPSAELCGDEIDSDCDGALSNGCSTDPDDDGLTTAEEQALGTDPFDADSDNDGVIDGDEAAGDSDGDDLIDALDVDSDNDGLLDGTEAGSLCDHPDSQPVNEGDFICVPDADPSTTTDPTNADSDGGTVFDGTEDLNRNGRIDAGETDPNRPEDDVALLCSEAEPCSDNLVCDGGICIEPCEEASCGESTVCDPTTRLCIERCENSDACGDDEVCDVEQGLCVTDPETKPETGVLVDGAGLRCSAAFGEKHSNNRRVSGYMGALVLLVLRRRRRGSAGLAR